MEKKITIINSYDDITLKKLMDIQAIEKTATDKYRTMRTIDIIYGLSEKEQNKMKASDIDKLINNINEAFAKEPEFKQRFKLDNLEYGIVPDLDKISFGELVDMDTFISKNEPHKLMSVLYRPIIETDKEKYNVASYDGERGKRMKDMPASIYLGVNAFFLRLGMDLTLSIQKSLLVEHPNLRKSILGKNGDGIHQYTH